MDPVQSQSPPTIAVELASPAVAALGATALLTADVEGSGPLQFQWFMNGATIEGATNAIHVLQPLERADDGIYSVVVTNSAGRATSEPARLLVSNIEPTRYMSLAVNSPTGGVWQIQYADSLATNALWRPMAGVTSSPAPLVIVDLTPTNASQRFYRTTQTNTLTGRMAPGWSYPDPTGSVHIIEFIDPQAGVANWRTLQTITLAQSPYLFVDATATNTASRRYRTTMTESPSRRRVGRLTYSVRWILPPEVYANAVQTNRAALTSLGIFLDDAEHALQMPTNVLGGYWVVLGDQRVMSDTNGNFTIDVPYGVTNGFVVPQRGDRSTYAEANFDVNQLALPGQTSSPILVRFEHEGVLNMNSPSQVPSGALPLFSPASGPVCGDPCRVGSLDPYCCRDYDGSLVNDGCRYRETDTSSKVQRVVRYFGSTCYSLVNEGLCFREYNSHAVGSRVSGLVCYDNHKYRNCQNVDLNAGMAFTISASATTVRCGESIDLAIHNNSRANETDFVLGAASRIPGKLSGTRVSVGIAPQNFTLRHFEEDVPRPFHVSDAVIQYTAPTKEEMKPGVEEMKIQIRAFAGGVQRMVEITVLCGGPDMAFIPAGPFVMGDPLNDYPGGNEQPIHTVQVSAFFMDKHEVTKALWDDVYNWAITHGYSFNFWEGKAANHPAHSMTWYDAVKWCNARSEKEGRTPAYYTSAAQTTVYRSGQVNVDNSWVKWNVGYRLPTEAEWEKAVRGGASGQRFPWGSTITHAQANYHGYPASSGGYAYDLAPLDYHPAFNDGGAPYTSPVGAFAPNGYGLYDMAGNVWEWCSDWYGVYSSGSQTDPRGPTTGSYRVIRGGGWGGHAFYCRSAYRYGLYPSSRISGFGFRSVLPPGQP